MKQRKSLMGTAGSSHSLLGYGKVHAGIIRVLQAAREKAGRSLNALMTASYWEIGRRIVEAEQGGKPRADYGQRLIERLAADLSSQFGRGYGVVNLTQMRRFYLAWPGETILQTASEESSGAILQTLSEESLSPVASHALPSDQPGTSDLSAIARRFLLPWSAYVRLLPVKDVAARKFYETEALRAGWSVRQLDRQIGSQFYERTALSRNKAAMLRKGEAAISEDMVTPEEAIKDPYVL